MQNSEETKKGGVWYSDLNLGWIAWLHHFLVVWLWITYLTSLCLSFLICKMGMKIDPTSKK